MTSDYAALEQQVMSLLLRELHVECPTPETDLLHARLLDSLGFATLVLGLQEEFGVEIALDDLELDSFRSVAAIARFLHQHRACAAVLDQDPRPHHTQGEAS